jgi:hypothetical protein
MRARAVSTPPGLADLKTACSLRCLPPCPALPASTLPSPSPGALPLLSSQLAPGLTWTAGVLTEAAEQLPAFTPRSLATVLFSLGAMGVKPNKEWMGPVLERVFKLRKWVVPRPGPACRRGAALCSGTLLVC